MPKAPKSNLPAPTAAAGKSKGKGKAVEEGKGNAKADIDDIFGAPAAAGSSKPVVASSAGGEAEGKKKKKKKLAADSVRSEVVEKKDKKDKSKPTTLPSSSTVQTILDPSSVPKPSQSSAPNPRPQKGQPAQPDEEEMMFRDSRGDGPRRKTEEGYLVYKEDELGIRVEAGDTPLCPFDCDCCF